MVNILTDNLSTIQVIAHELMTEITLIQLMLLN